MFRCLPLGLAALSLLAAGALQAADWKPITPEELALKKSATDPNADAEALFRDVRVRNEKMMFGYPTNVITEYVRLKIFTGRGKEKYSTVQIPYYGKSGVSGVEGRTIHPDGSIVPLGKDAIFEKVVERRNGVRTKVVSFAFPAVEPGSIIEYRYNYDVGEFITRYVPLDVQSEFPTDLVDFHIKPVTGVYQNWPKMRYLPFGCNVERGQTGPDGFTELMVRNVPAFHEEPYMPPERYVKAWILVYYEENDRPNPDAYWKEVGHSLNGEFARMVKVNAEVKSIAAQATEGAKTDDEKLVKLADYCRKNIKDVEGARITTEEREKSKENHTTADTLKQGQGTAWDIHLAFLSLALASGFDARIARLADTETFIFSPSVVSAYFLNRTAIAVNAGGKWEFYDVPNPNVPIGHLPWHEEGTPALMVDSKDSQFVPVPMMKSTESRMNRIGNFTLTPEGDLEGDVREMYFGHEADIWRARFAQESEDERVRLDERRLKQRFAEFEATDFKHAVPPDLNNGVSVVYHIKVKGYAQRTGKRLFFTPGYFEEGAQARFTEEKRELPVYFRYPWSEMDTVTIQLPSGYSMDHGDAPSPVSFAPIGQYVVQMSIDKSNKLTYTRRFVFGSDSLLLFDAKNYPTIKKIFDRIHDGDNHMLTLKAGQEATAPGQ